MLFRKNIEPMCVYCSHSRELNEQECACPKKGVVSLDYHCRRFSYDPLKRVPPAPTLPDFSKFSDEEFEL